MAENSNMTISGKGKSYIKENHEILLPSEVGEAEATQMFDSSIKEAENTVNTSVERNLNQPQFDALVGVAYDMGNTAFVSSDLLKKVNEKASAKAIKDAIKSAPGTTDNEANAKGRRKHDAMLWTKVRNQWIAGGIILAIVFVLILVMTTGKKKKKSS